MAQSQVYQGPEYLRAVGAPGAQLPLDPLLHADPARPPRLYLVVLAILRWVLPRLFRFRVEGLDNVPAAPCIIASNHQAWYDTAFIVAAFPKQHMVYTMARRDTVFNRTWKRWLMARLGVFPISPSKGELDVQGVATVYRLLSRGAVVLIFPEGRYSRGRELRPLKSGLGHYALQAGVPICPVAVSGLERLRPAALVTVRIGPAIRPDPPRWWDANRRVARVVENVRQAILGAFGPERRQRRRAWWRRAAGGLGRRRREAGASRRRSSEVGSDSGSA